MKTIIYLLIAIGWMFYLSQPTISFKPFSIEFAKPYLPFAWLFLIFSVVLFQIQSDKIGYEKGVKDTIEKIKEEIEKK